MAHESATARRPANRDERPNETTVPDLDGDEPSAVTDTHLGPTVGSRSVSRRDRSGDQWWNRTRYQLYAPIYDWLAGPWEAGRKRAIDRLDSKPGDRVLILGCGTGADLEYLPVDADVVAIDRSPAMVRRTAERAERLDLDVDARVGDAQSVSVDDDSFDAVLLHLVLSVVAEPEAVVEETARVLRADGRVSIYDKFVPAGETPSLPRRAVNPLARFLFADFTRSLEPMLAGTGLQTGEREPFLGGIYTVTIAGRSIDG